MERNQLAKQACHHSLCRARVPPYILQEISFLTDDSLQKIDYLDDTGKYLRCVGSCDKYDAA